MEILTVPQLAVPTASAAMALVNRWLHREVGMAVHTTVAHFDATTFCWHLPIELAYATHGTLGVVGDVYLHAATGTFVGRPSAEDLPAVLRGWPRPVALTDADVVSQEQPTSCVAACVRMVLTGFGVVWTEEQIRTVFRRPRLGITLTAAHTRLVHAGARAALHEDWSLDDLCERVRRGHYPIVGVERHLLGHPPASHAIVVVQITSRAVHVLDPVEGPQPQRYGREAFVLAWQMAGHEALVVEVPPSRPAP